MHVMPCPILGTEGGENAAESDGVLPPGAHCCERAFPSGVPREAPFPLKFFRTLIVKSWAFASFLFLIEEYFTYSKMQKS